MGDETEDIKEYIDSQYGDKGVQCRGNSKSKILVALPKSLDDFSSMLLDLNSRFGVTCDLGQDENGASLSIWHTGGRGSQDFKQPSACTPLALVLSLLLVITIAWAAVTLV